MFPNTLDYGLQVRTIMASKFISELAQSRPPSVSPNSHNHSLQTRSIAASKCISPNMFDLGIEVHLQTCSMIASTLAQLWPPSVSPNTLDYCLLGASPYLLDDGLRVFIRVHSIDIFRRTSNCSQAPRAATVQIYRLLMGSEIDT